MPIVNNNLLKLFLQEMVYEVAEYGHGKFNCAQPKVLRQIFNICTEMANEFQSSIRLDTQSGDYPVETCLSGPCGPVTYDYILKCFGEAFDAYPMGEDLITEYIMYTKGTPYSSKHWLGRFWVINSMRFRFVLKSCGAAISGMGQDQCDDPDYGECILYLALIKQIGSILKQFSIRKRKFLDVKIEL